MDALDAAALILIGGLLIGLAVGMRVAFVLLAAGLLAFGVGEGLAGLRFAGDIPFTKASNFNFLAIPFYLLFGALLAEARVMERLAAMVNAWFGQLPGSLGVASLLVAGVFGAVSGSGAAAASALGTTFAPIARRFGFNVRFMAGILNGGASLDPLIPPSIALVIYSELAEQSLIALYAAAIVPGLFAMMLMIIWVVTTAILRPSLAPRMPTPPLRERVASLQILPVMVFLIVIVLGGIFVGWYTPSEAAALGIVVVLLILASDSLARRGQFAGRLWKATREAGSAATVIAILLVAAFIYSHVLIYFSLPQAVAAFLTQAQLGPHAFILLLSGLLLVMGCFVDSTTMQIVTVPLLAPVAFAMGIDPLWFGIYVLWFMEIGTFTPPFGIHLFILQASMGISYGEAVRGALPLIPIWLIGAATLVLFPDLVTWLPQMMGLR
jgi:tripartite ATP-independent transporter DctM subunit